MAQDNAPPIVIKKVRKGRHHHHGGAWKVAYADFVTAMMAFFLLLWLLNATTEEQRRGIAEYFTPTAVSTSSSGAGGILGGRSLSPDGAMVSTGGAPSVSLELRPTSGASDGDAAEDTGGSGKNEALSEEQLREQIERLEEEQFRKAEAEIRQAIQESPELRELEQNLIVDRTPEGLRIQIVDQEGRSMFPRGSAAMLDRTRVLLRKIAGVITALPNKISISGHTDSTPYRGSGGFTNWELSASRANASRRELIAGGLSPKRVARVVGRADKEPLVKEDPTSPRNRRIAIVLLRQKPAGGGAQASRAAPRPVRPFKKDWTGPRLR